MRNDWDFFLQITKDQRHGQRSDVRSEHTSSATPWGDEPWPKNWLEAILHELFVMAISQPKSSTINPEGQYLHPSIVMTNLQRCNYSTAAWTTRFTTEASSDPSPAATTKRHVSRWQYVVYYWERRWVCQYLEMSSLLGTWKTVLLLSNYSVLLSG